MKLYIANGQYVGTQAEAKKLDRDFEPIEVPTDKEGLIAYLNRVILVSTVVERVYAEDLTTAATAMEPIQPRTSYTEQSVALDDQWEKLPLARKLHFAALAMEDARIVINRPSLLD